MKVTHTTLNDVWILEPTVHVDDRGFFMESYHSSRLHDLGIDITFVQDNHSLSVVQGTLRGLHYQLAPKAQTKLVRVLVGEIWDVAVDIRPHSSQFGQWTGVKLSAENKLQLLIPAGFAHGFCTLTPYAEVLYKVDNYYSPELDRGIRWNDSTLNIPWPSSSPILSDKDERLPLLVDAELPGD
ncbi:dTDP-4-dehydrorhamnose 3,5-epimerase [Paenibacillus sp. ACRRX]|uniref:dTDP-4-dehydrorhamnose 3,5-epimerase n=1 Tax=Paenibacillus sp. ACRRX TaxID=2918206 RepID=UPI001EF453DD|nr:dTDP-4-dehydrorhamnose 3,5-epimerase [Paenibacillus sp. ACRRX]MCG7408983.1 dTDP-4-dehydrorhamnose 3,5-epimerase [Paenibacillus sp. ACRRX]